MRSVAAVLFWLIEPEALGWQRDPGQGQHFGPYDQLMPRVAGGAGALTEPEVL